MDCRLNDKNFEDKLKERDEEVIDYLKFLSLCHTVTIDKKPDEPEKYTAASPDEIAFV